MRTLVAILALSPALLHAQVPSSAQPVSTPILRAGLDKPSIGTNNALTAPAASATNVVIEPVRLNAVPHALQIATDRQGQAPRPLSVLVLDVALDATGKPGDVMVLSSNDPLANQAVINSIRDFRYQPATLNGVAIPYHVRLSYQISQRQN